MDSLVQSAQPKLYFYQENDIDTVFRHIEQKPINYKLLYQLPTGGGKTVIFSEITRRFIEKYNKKVTVLTHRNELCNQTSTTLKKVGVNNKIINSSLQRLPEKNKYNCYVAMVETLKNRLKQKKIQTSDVGLIIIDEAHHNSFTKLINKFPNAFVIGVTATPFSSDRTLPMYKSYDELITGQNIKSLIEKGYLAKPKTYVYDIELTTLKTGKHGDYTVATSDELYSTPAMIDLLLHSYETTSKNKKTLIFNNGIFTSKKVCERFEAAGYPVKHLDSKIPAAERREILKWFKKTKGAVLTSVSILTTGFDEPSVQTVILNRATTSLTLYHQMIGRGSRKLPNKKTFSIIDLGNNTDRFGEWSDPVDWEFVFKNPDAYYDQLNYGNVSESIQSHHIPSECRSVFANSLEISFDIEQAFKDALEKELKPKTVIQMSIRQHAKICIENSETITEALEHAAKLEKEILWRVKLYTKLLGNATKSYRDWLLTDYESRLEKLIIKTFSKSKQSALQIN